ncbi:MAG: hypothetical protein JNJ46_04435 [Myxococcales bacterium]|nr:hypothetical protein [Myxococcales bacterium]
MRTCVSCGDEIPEKKRKDAKYCDKPGCRGREYRKRQAEAQAAEGKPHTHHATTLLTCECGRRYKIQISALDEPPSRPDPAQPTATPQAITETVLPTAQRTAAQDTGPELQAAAREAVTQAVLLTDLGAQIAEDGAASEAETAAAVTQAVLLTDQQPAEDAAASEAETAATVTQAVLLTDQQPAQAEAPSVPTAMYDPQGFTETDRSGAQASGVLTLELYFLRAGKHRLSLHQAVIRRRDGTWTLQPQTRAAFSLGAADRSSLGGRPGGWGRYYAGHSPVEFGFDEDLVVMFWDQKARRGWVAQTGLLRKLLGDGWKAKLREHAGGT